MAHGIRAPLAALAAAVLVAAGCGSGASAAARPAPPALPQSALPGMDVTQKPMTADDLARDAPIPGLADRVRGWGYESGVQRVFTGNTPQFSNVISRALRFGSAAGARAYVTLLDTHVADYYGTGSKVAPLRSRGRAGYLIDAASCGCHRETPIYIAAVSHGPVVTWLYATGRGSTPQALRALLAHAP